MQVVNGEEDGPYLLSSMHLVPNPGPSRRASRIFAIAGFTGAALLERQVYHCQTGQCRIVFNKHSGAKSNRNCRLFVNKKKDH